MKWILETMTPLQIGSGEELHRDLDFVSVDGQHFVVDQNATFDAFAVTDVSLKNLGELPSFVKEVHRQFGKYFGYALPPLSSAPSSNEKIREQVKDAFARPLIPGSSLKGAIRTAIFAEFLRGHSERLQNKLPYKRNGRPSAGQKTAALNLTQSCFSAGSQDRGKHPNYDWMRLWKIGDSAFSPSDLRLADVRFLNITNSGLQWKDFSGRRNIDDWKQAQGILAEVLQPGSRTMFDVVFSQDLWDAAEGKLQWQGVPRDFAELRKILNAHAQYRIDREYKFYQKHGWSSTEIYADLLQKMNAEPEAIYLQLGWGSGWRGMTGDWMDEQTENDMRKLYNLRPNNPLFPKTRRLAFADGKPDLPFGWVRIRDAEKHPDLRRKTETALRNENRRLKKNQKRIRELIVKKTLEIEEKRKQAEVAQKQAEAQSEQKRLEAEKRRQQLESLSPLERLIEELREDPNYKSSFGKLNEFEGEEQRKLAEFFKERFVESGEWEVKPKKKKQFEKVQQLKKILGEPT